MCPLLETIDSEDSSDQTSVCVYFSIWNYALNEWKMSTNVLAGDLDLPPPAHTVILIIIERCELEPNLSIGSSISKSKKTYTYFLCY